MTNSQQIFSFPQQNVPIFTQIPNQRSEEEVVEEVHET